MKPSRRKSAVFLAGLTALISFYPLIASAAINPADLLLNKPFGGKITKIQACQNPEGLLLHIGRNVCQDIFCHSFKFVGEKYLLTDSSKIHQYYNITPGTWTLGLAEPVPVECRGNPSPIGGFSAGNLIDGALESGLIDVAPLLNEFDEVIGTVFSGPLGEFIITGPFGEGLAELISAVIPGLQIISLAFAVFSFAFPKKPPSLGSAYPIIRIGTGPEPASNLSPPLLTPI